MRSEDAGSEGEAMRVSDYILKRLADEGVTHFTHVYGAACGELLDAVTRQDRIKHVCFLHEQGSGFAAEGISKAGGFGVCIVTSGPGGGNLITPIQNCHYDSVPALFITGQVNSKFMRRNSEVRQRGFQETDIVRTVEGITKYARCVKDYRDIPQSLEDAIFYARSGRPGPTLLDIPIDVQKQEMGAPELDYEEPRKRELVTEDPTAAINDFLHNLDQSKRPLILIGGGCANYKEEFHALAKTLQIPCVATWNALDIVTSDSPFYAGRVGTYGGAGRNFSVANCDLLLAIGCRISGRITGGLPETFSRGAKRYFVDIDPALLKPENQDVKAHVNIHANAGRFMRLLAQRAKRKDAPDWLAQCRQWVERYDPVQERHRTEWHPYGFLRYLSELMPSDAIIVNDTGGAVISFAHAFETKRGQRYFTNNGNTPMGFSFAAAMGAAIHTKRPVFCLIGDGGFNMNIQELQTLKRLNLDVRTIILNNRIYGNTSSFQDANYGGRRIACAAPDYIPPDFVRVAKAYDVPAYRIERKWDNGNHSYQANTMDEWLPRLVATPGPWVCDVVHDGFCTYEPRMVRWDCPVEEMTPHLPRDEFKRNMIGVEPWKGWEEIK